MVENDSVGDVDPLPSQDFSLRINRNLNKVGNIVADKVHVLLFAVAHNFILMALFSEFYILPLSANCK